MRKMATMTTTTKAAFTQGCSTEQAVDKEIRPVAVVMTTLKSTTFSQSEPFFGPNHTGGGKVWEMIWSHASLLYHKHYHLQQRQHKSPFSGLLKVLLEDAMYRMAQQNLESSQNSSWDWDTLQHCGFILNRERALNAFPFCKVFLPLVSFLKP